MDEVDSRFICPICFEVLKKPVVVRGCKHRFCEECLRALRPLDSNGCVQCPICRVAFEPQACDHDRTLEDEIRRSTVDCGGCRQKFLLLYFNSHVVTCKKRVPAYGGSPPRHPQAIPVNRSTFKCPYCSSGNLDFQALSEHVLSKHSNSKIPVVCPICASMPWGKKDQTSSDFIAHLDLRHRFEYDTYVDFEQDEEESLRAALEASRLEQH